MPAQPSFTANGCSRLVRSIVTFLGASFCVAVGAAEISKSATLDEVLALATRQEPPNKDEGYYTERFSALQRLGEWPKTSAADEARIAAALLASLRATGGNFRSAGASGLGLRGHSDAIPIIITLGEKEPTLITSFFERYSKHPEAEPSVKFLRPGLVSKNRFVRSEILSAIASCKAVTLRSEVEAILASDSSSEARNEAAITLARACTEL